MKLTTSIIINESENIPLNDESKGMSIGEHIDHNIEKYISSMKKILSRIIEIDNESINIKATTTDGLGFIGREEGIACLAISTLEELK